MKIAHLADLHLGIRLHDYLLLEDQDRLLDAIIEVLQEEAVDVLLITGDIYDKSNPSEGAIALWNKFLSSLAEMDLITLVIAGNHDSSQRLGFADHFLAKESIYVETEVKKVMKKIVLEDAYGPVYFHFLPFFRPAHIRNLFDDFEGKTYQEAAEYYLQEQNIDPQKRNVLLMHQFVISSEDPVLLSDSENSPRVGGLDSIDASLFKDFDYVAMGHIHRPQRVAHKFIRYAGSPMKYSFSESNHDKSIPILHLKEKGQASLKLLPMPIVRDVKKIQGPFEALLNEAKKAPSEDIYHVILENKELIHNPLERLRPYYPYALSLEMKGIEAQEQSLQEAKDVIKEDPIALFESFFKRQIGRDLMDDEKEILEEVLEEIQ